MRDPDGPDDPSKLEAGGGGCPACGSAELRDGWSDDQAKPPPRNSYGSWIVCLDCRKEWPDPTESDARPQIREQETGVYPPSEWIPHPANDSADYLDGPTPLREGDLTPE